MFVTEAGGPKIRLVFCRNGDYFADRGRRQEGHLENVCESDGIIFGIGPWKRAYDKILEQGLAMFKVNVGTSCEVRGLLEEDGIGAENLAHIYRNFLDESWGYREEQAWVMLTSFWAEKIEFMIGM